MNSIIYPMLLPNWHNSLQVLWWLLSRLHCQRLLPSPWPCHLEARWPHPRTVPADLQLLLQLSPVPARWHNMLLTRPGDYCLGYWLWSYDYGHDCGYSYDYDYPQDYRSNCPIIGAPRDASVEECEDVVLDTCSGFLEEDCDYLGQGLDLDPPDGEISARLSARTFSHWAASTGSLTDTSSPAISYSRGREGVKESVDLRNPPYALPIVGWLVVLQQVYRCQLDTTQWAESNEVPK